MNNNIATYFINNKIISWMLALLFLVGGTLSFLELGRLEDPAFTVKDAQVITSYPGATPQEVEEEVTYPLEKAIKQLPYVKRVKSTSTDDVSVISVSMREIYGPNELPQIWDELRRKVNDIQGSLPPGVAKPKVVDDYGDVFGILMSISGPGYSYADLVTYVDYLRRELELVKGVAKVNVSGNQQEQVFIDLSMKNLSNLGIAPQAVFQLLKTQNEVISSGAVKIGDEYIRLRPTGDFQSVQALGDLIISTGKDGAIFLRDVAEIHRGYKEIPSSILTYDSETALTLGISFSGGVNVVEVGKRIDQRLAELEPLKPIGIHTGMIYNQSSEVDGSVKGFVQSLVEAIVIVIVVLLIFMGIRSGVLIGLILLLTVLGTFIFMKYLDIELQRISLGALVIALGMLVDNAIVVVEGILIGMKKGLTRMQAAAEIVTQTKWPLLGATVIAISAFAPIGLSADATGEYCGTLFSVLLISLILSWVTAITLTPFFAHLFFKEEVSEKDGENEDPYKGMLFVLYRKFLQLCMQRSLVTCLILVVALGGAVVGFGKVKQAFFPSSTTPMFLVDIMMPEGTDIRATAERVSELEKWMMGQPNIEFVTTSVGGGNQRFILTYAPERASSSYGELIVRTKSYEDVVPTLKNVRKELETNYPNVQFKLKRIELGPSSGSKVEARIVGSDPTVLRRIASEVEKIMAAEPDTVNLRHDWRERTKVIRPQFNESQARRYGISKQDLDDTLQMWLSGTRVGLYRDGTTQMPIIARVPEEEKQDDLTIGEMKIWSPALQQYIPLRQIILGYESTWQDPIIVRRDRKRVLTVFTDPDPFGSSTAASLQARIQPKVEAIDLPEGYSIEWGGEYESSRDAQASLFSSMPMGYLFMFLVTVLLFNSVRDAFVVWATVPLAIIGVTTGLLGLSTPFGFMALLGFLSLSGMLVKNGIVLIEQINIELEAGKERYQAIIDASVSRVRPVCMAAITTILGMVPLFSDVFFRPMAVTIMFGLGFATILTLIVVPVLYKMAYRARDVG
ncbi:efflux RND transporter permease subunit [Veronia pacifica]|uniref:Multidrug transporter AcrB n=1 Tax=Veronia pacifica TaxID=1080227 RepID=A0A1C3EPI1_9GAMM|nr:efflux RND transporter permease subunit [Veronia pacifica]ODA35119.1 multidrug transporter AcrB [Veronia pacifica]